MPPPRGESPLTGLSHLTPEGEARMVDITAKAESARQAVARVAGVRAAKRTPDLIPLCHPLRITGVEVTFQLNEKASTLGIEARVRTVDKTGVEMEALTAAAVAGPTVYEMVKGGGKG